jgi:DNA-binding IclR family transcriptional regulator
VPAGHTVSGARLAGAGALAFSRDRLDPTCCGRAGGRRPAGAGDGALMANAPAAGQALDVLGFLARHGEPVPAAAIARDLRLPRSSVYHLLAVLVDRGYVRHLPEQRRYGLGLAAYELGSAYQRQAPLERLARGTMDRLVDATGHNAHLAVLHGRDVLYVIEQRASGRPLLVTDVGVRLPAVLTGSGMAMLAALPAAQVRALYPDRGALVQRDGRGPASTAVLRSQLQAVRQRGHAVEDGLVTPGLGSVAVAVLDANDYPVAGVAVTFPQQDLDRAAVATLVSAVGSAAGTLSARLGRAR